MFDCIIVGAGPAGGAAAYHLAKRGRSVLVIEKESLPRRKACSGGVSPAIARWFDFDFSPAIALKVKKVRYTWKLEDPVEAELPEAMWMVNRATFDNFLIEKARSQGAEIKDGTEVTGIEFKSDRWQVNTTGEPFTARYLIAADGANGPMAKWLGFKEAKKRQSYLLEVPVAEISNPVVRFEFGLVKNGSIWSFPGESGYSISTATFRGGEPKNLDKELNEYAKQFGSTGNNKIQKCPLCLWDGERKLHGQNAILAGETAGILDPLSAEGIRPSIFSGVKAAEAVDAALGGNGDALKKYTQIINEEWGADMVWAGRLAGAFYRFPKVAYKAGVKRPTASLIMSKILCGEMRYGEVANKAIKRLSNTFLPGRG
ncbi:MAG: geranylgeranyl reductase family protein [Okeania sp. SIO2H7]|nr:geranylgeranyl reductase family protein [Okeania sp. SIO2H7]